VADKLSPDRRSANMRAIKSRDTSPEMAVRRALYEMGYRYRLHTKDLPGKPDLVFHGRRKAVFVHGCFWHQHTCREGHTPASNTAYWEPKLARNTKRDRSNLADLKLLGWEVMVIWECEVDNIGDVARRLRKFLGPRG
jgi:DNA mismatch endonuclease (patch repair protein)